MNNPVKKIIFVIEAPFDKRIYDTLGIKTIQSLGFDVEVWDVTPYFHQSFLKKITLDESTGFDKCRIFKNKKNIITALMELSDDTVVVLHIAYQLETFFIYYLLSKRNVRYCVQQMIFFPSFPTPTTSEPVEILRSLFKRVISLRPRHAFIGFCNILLFRYHTLFSIRPADMAILSGERSYEVVRDPIGKETHPIWCHVDDYDIYLKERTVPVDPEPDLGIFLDEYYPLHTDLDYLGISSPISADEYYTKLCAFFEYLEKTHNVRIMIAAHPRSNYTGSPDYFNGRKIVKGQTSRLVHQCSFVLAHDSISIAHAILFKKPALFLTMDKMQKCDAGRLTTALSIQFVAEALKKKPINLDEPLTFSWSDELTVDEEAYSRYKNDILKKKGTPDIPSYEIFVKEIRKLYG